MSRPEWLQEVAESVFGEVYEDTDHYEMFEPVPVFKAIVEACDIVLALAAVDVDAAIQQGDHYNPEGEWLDEIWKRSRVWLERNGGESK